MRKHLYSSSIAKKHCAVFLLVMSGAFAALYSFYRYDQRAAIQGARTALARDQLELVERMPLQAELIVRGSTEQKYRLQQRIARFDRILETLERGRPAEQGRLALPAANGRVKDQLFAVKSVWSTVRAELFAVISGSTDRLAVAYDELRASERQLEQRSEDLLNAETARFGELQSEVLETLQLVAVVDGILFLVALVLSRRFIERPLRLLEDATHRITAGEFGTQVPIVTNDELASLGRSFNTMSAKLAQLIEFEKQMVRAQKMEAVGQLASGAAHDFNNLLLGIIGHAEFALEGSPVGSAARDDLNQILELAQHGAALNRQLLVFSRQQPITRKPLDLNRALTRTVETLRRTIGEDIAVTLTPGTVGHLISADPTHLDQVVMNLAINARDAMPSGGRLTVETQEVRVSGNSREVPDFVHPGNYVMLSVRDSGCGMNHQTLGRVFEPYFTTKEVGKGNGLGLASVYAIMKQHGGNVVIESEPGQGTVVTTYWPRTDIPVAAEKQERNKSVEGGDEHILLVEDQAPIRAIVTRTLTRLGYRVTEVESAAQAELWIARHGFDFDLLLTDVVMPGLSGPDLYARLAQRHPGLRVLFASGAVERAKADKSSISGHLLGKPFTTGELAAAVRTALGGTTRAEPLMPVFSAAPMSFVTH